MKTQTKWVIACTCLCMATGSGFGQATDQGTQPRTTTDQTTNTREAGQSQQFCHSKDVVGASVKDAQGQKLGDIHDIIFNPQNGQAFAAISVGHSTFALVPTQALSVTPGTKMLSRKADVTLNTTKEELETGPSIANDEWEKLGTPGFTQSIYSHYKLQAPASVGGVGASSLSGTSKGEEQGTNTTEKPNPQRQ